jgi:hypothetical protein
MNEPNECSVCLQYILPDHECITDCTHVFCEPCIREVFRIGKSSCPLCRAQINEIVVRDETQIIVRVQEPPVTHTIQGYPLTYINQRLKRLAILGVSVLGVGMFYFAYYVWDNYENLTETRRDLKICEETLRHTHT